MSSANLDLVGTFRAMVADQGPAAAIAAHGTDDFIWWASGHGEIQDSVDAVMAIMRANYDERGMQWTTIGATADGDRVALEAVCKVTLKNGAVYNNQFHFLFQIRDGRIAVMKEYHDTAHANEIWLPIFTAASAHS